MASETMQQRDYGDECDGKGCSCVRDDGVSLVLRRAVDRVARMPPEAVGCFNVPAELLAPCVPTPAFTVPSADEGHWVGNEIVHLFLPISFPTPHLPEFPAEQIRIHMGNGTNMTLAEISEAIGVSGEDLVALMRGQAAIVARAVQPEERKP